MLHGPVGLRGGVAADRGTGRNQDLAALGIAGHHALTARNALSISDQFIEAGKHQSVNRGASRDITVTAEVRLNASGIVLTLSRTAGIAEVGPVDAAEAHPLGAKDCLGLVTVKAHFIQRPANPDPRVKCSSGKSIMGSFSHFAGVEVVIHTNTLIGCMEK